MNLEAVTREDWIVGGTALLMAIDLLLFPWFSFGYGPVSLDLTGTDGPNSFFGVLAVLLALAVVADVAVERLSPQTTLPTIGGARTMTRFVLAVAAVACMALKFLLNIHFSYFGWGFYLGVVLAVALVAVTKKARDAT